MRYVLPWPREAAPPDCTPASPVSLETCRERGHCPQLGRASPGLLSYARHVSELMSDAPTIW